MSRGSPKVLLDERPASLFYYEDDEPPLEQDARSRHTDHASHTIHVYDLDTNQSSEMSLEDALASAELYALRTSVDYSCYQNDTPPNDPVLKKDVEEALPKEMCFACTTRQSLVGILVDCCSVAEPSICIELTRTIDSLLERLRACCLLAK